MSDILCCNLLHIGRGMQCYDVACSAPLQLLQNLLIPTAAATVQFQHVPSIRMHACRNRQHICLHMHADLICAAASCAMHVLAEPFVSCSPSHKNLYQYWVEPSWFTSHHICSYAVITIVTTTLLQMLFEMFYMSIQMKSRVLTIPVHTAELSSTKLMTEAVRCTQETLSTLQIPLCRLHGKICSAAVPCSNGCHITYCTDFTRSSLWCCCEYLLDSLHRRNIP